MDAPQLQHRSGPCPAARFGLSALALTVISGALLTSLASGVVAGMEVEKTGAEIAVKRLPSQLGDESLPSSLQVADEGRAPAVERATQIDSNLSVNGVAELVRYDDPNRPDRRQIDSDIYTLLTGQSGYAWPDGSGDGGLESGVGLLTIPSLAKAADGTGAVSTIAITNLVARPGFTDFNILVYDQNGLLDYVCEKLNEKQTEYIDLHTWGYINPGFSGSALVSASFWEHDLFDDTGKWVRNSIGLTGVVQEQPPYPDLAQKSSFGSLVVPLYPQAGARLWPEGWEHGRILCPSGPGRWPTSVPEQTPGPSPTSTDTPTATYTPTPTSTPSVAPLYAGTSPHVMLPVLTDLGPSRTCPAEIVVQNVGAEDSKVALITWGEPGPCGRDDGGPLKVECSGLIIPGSTWTFTGPFLPAGAQSAALFSFNMRSIADVLPVQPVRPIADVMCEALQTDLPGDEAEYVIFKQAFASGWEYSGVPMQAAWGAPMVAQLRRSCGAGGGSEAVRAAEYTGASGPALGYAESDPPVYEYTLPLFNPGDGQPRSFAHVQNVGDECATAELWVEDRDECNSPTRCEMAEIAPGEAVMFDGRSCSADGAQSAVVRATGPVVVAVDVATSSVFASYLAPATEFRTLAGEALLGDSEPVAYAPLVYKNYRGWTTVLHLQNTGTESSLLRATFLDRAGDAVSVRQFGPLCPGARTAIDLETVGGIPYWWMGSVRIESLPAADGPVATPWTPEPTATAEGTMWPTTTPRTPGPSPTGTAGTVYPTATTFPTSTPYIQHTLYLPIVSDDHPIGICRGVIEPWDCFWLVELAKEPPR